MKAIKIINRLKDINKEITKLWDIIAHNNISPKTIERTVDLKETYRKIKDLANQRVQTKLHLQAVNSGFVKFSEFPKNSNYLRIFWLSEINELKRNWENKVMKNTIPTAKKKKARDKITITEIYSRIYVQNLIQELNTKIIVKEQELASFNESVDFDDTGVVIEDIFQEEPVSKPKKEKKVTAKAA